MESLNITKWLQDELGLTHMCESDLNALIYHPRLGSLCRRFVRFLVESSLCGDKYPNLLAKEEFLAATELRDAKSEELSQIVKQLEEYSREAENEERELDCLKQQLENMRKTKDLVGTTTDAFKQLLDRSILDCMQIDDQIKDSLQRYLNTSHLLAMYAFDDNPETTNTSFTQREMCEIDKQYSNLIDEVNRMHRGLSVLVSSVSNSLNSIDMDKLQPFKTTTDELQSLKIQPIEQKTIEPHLEERILHEQNMEIYEKIRSMDQQVVEMAKQYKQRRSDIDAKLIAKLKESLSVLNDIRCLARQ